QPLRSQIANRFVYPFALRHLQHAFEEWRLGAINTEFGRRNALPDEREGLDGKIQPVPFDQRPVIHDYEWLSARWFFGVVGLRRAELENPFIRGIHDHLNLLRPTAARRENSLAGKIDCDDRIGARDAPFLDSFHEPHARTVFVET